MIIKLKDLIIESTFDDAFLKWKTEGVNETDIELYIDKFKILKNRNVIRGSESDISQWIKGSFEEFRKFVDEKDEKYQQIVATKSTGRDIDRIFENDKVIIISPNTWEASCKYGAGTRWCISGHVRKHWNNYTNHGIKFYFIIPKQNRDKKYAVAVYVNGVEKEIYDELDKIISEDEFGNILKRYNIPGESFFKNEIDWNKWLKHHKYKIRSDGKIDIIDGNVNLNNMKLTKLPFNFGKVDGFFVCGGNNLTTLEGSPHTVGRDFYCNHNNLTTLEICPQIVGGNFSCDYNKLTTLEGAPQTVGGGFYCSNQKSGKKFTEEEVRAICNVKRRIYT